MSTNKEVAASDVCPACGEFERKTFGRKGGLDIFICRNCQSLYTPRSGVQTANYDDSYAPDSVHANVPTFVNKRLDEIVATFAAYRKNNRFLDVGCGSGVFLQAAERAKWDAEGTEVSQSSVDLLKSNNLKVFQGFLQDANYASETFDVVVASNVLEHIPEPREVVEEIYRVMRPGGFFWLAVPQGRGISSRLLGDRWSQVEPPVHWCLFSRKGMKILLKDCGFKQIKTSLEGVDPFEIKNVLLKKNNPQTAANGTTEKFDDVESRRQLCGTLSASPTRRFVKDSLNYILNVSSLGDFLKAQAVK